VQNLEAARRVVMMGALISNYIKAMSGVKRRLMARRPVCVAGAGGLEL
jgi:hypothetical protein